MSNVILLGLTSLLADFSSEIIIPLLPFFITSLGGAGLAIGLVTGVGDAVAAILKVGSGYWSDRIRRYKLFVYLGYGFSAVAKFFFPFVSSWPQFLIARSVERVGKGFRDAPRDAIISESIGHENRGRAFGIQRAMDSAGAILGSVFALLFYWYFNLSFNHIFLIAAIIALFAVLPLFFVKVPKILSSRVASKISFSKLNSDLKKFIFISSIFALANFSFLFFILKSQKAFEGLGVVTSITLPLVLYIFFNIFDTAFSSYAGSLSDRIGRKPVILISYLLFIVTSIGFIYANSFILFLLLFVLYGLFKAFIDGTQRAFVSDLSPLDIRATALGTFEMTTGILAIPAGLIAGFLWNLNTVFPFLFGVVIAFVSFLLLNFSIRNTKEAF